MGGDLDGGGQAARRRGENGAKIHASPRPARPPSALLGAAQKPYVMDGAPRPTTGRVGSAESDGRVRDRVHAGHTEIEDTRVVAQQLIDGTAGTPRPTPRLS